MKTKFTLFPLVIILVGCSSNESEIIEQTNSIAPVNSVEFDIRELSDDEYPDNPDKGFRSSNYRWNGFEKGVLKNLEKGSGDLSFFGEGGDTIWLDNIDFMEFIPTIPKSVKDDEYLTYLSLINQEWNRNQVRFTLGEFNSNNAEIVRVDLARNCLNSYLWEIIAYTEEDGKTVPQTHGWFDFPKATYADLFEEKNGTPFNLYKMGMEDWVDPESKELNLDLLRLTEAEIELEFTDLSDGMYPLAGARQKKFKEIIVPKSFTSMRALQSDSTTFATFSVPGFYNRADPRTTELGRLYTLHTVNVSKLVSDSSLYELQFKFTDRLNERITKLYIGGINLLEMPILKTEECNSGWKNSMGIGNHTFYETYSEHECNSVQLSPYYGVLTNENSEWLDSHKIGIDGPVIHRDYENPNKYHVWLLSFERHAFVGHYSFTLKLS